MYREPYKQLKTNFSNGHSDGSGRFPWFSESAYCLALIFEMERLAIGVLLFMCSFCLDAKRTKKSKRFVRKLPEVPFAKALMI
tara:strand:+ start:328 stop:576 length:249 start_codon:yes stop_codon:yes gene_type:complete